MRRRTIHPRAARVTTPTGRRCRPERRCDAGARRSGDGAARARLSRLAFRSTTGCSAQSALGIRETGRARSHGSSPLGEEIAVPEDRLKLHAFPDKWRVKSNGGGGAERRMVRMHHVLVGLAVLLPAGSAAAGDARELGRLTAKAAIVVDAQTGEIHFARNPNLQLRAGQHHQAADRDDRAAPAGARRDPAGQPLRQHACRRPRSGCAAAGP